MGLTGAQAITPARLNERLGATLPEARVSVRSEVATDLDFSAGLYALTRREELSVVPWSEVEKLAFCRAQFDAQHAHYRQHYPNAHLLIVEVDGRPAGRVYFEATAKELRLMEITLLDAFRGRGVGGAISGALLAMARESGLGMSLHVEPFNPARRLYERQGFKPVETRGLYLFMVASPSTSA